jgi:hypothetical protein
MSEIRYFKPESEVERDRLTALAEDAIKQARAHARSGNQADAKLRMDEAAVYAQLARAYS